MVFFFDFDLLGVYKVATDAAHFMKCMQDTIPPPPLTTPACQMIQVSISINVDGISRGRFLSSFSYYLHLPPEASWKGIHLSSL
jgi:hypothetical protein